MRAASPWFSGPAAAKRTATRWPASVESATSPGCSKTRVEPTSARRRVRAGSTLDTLSDYRQPPPPDQQRYDDQTAEAEQRSPREGGRLQENFDIVLASVELNSAEHHVGAQHGRVDAVDASAPAGVPGLALQ